MRSAAAGSGTHDSTARRTSGSAARDQLVGPEPFAFRIWYSGSGRAGSRCEVPGQEPEARPATWGQRSAPSDTARSDSSISSRHSCGAASTWTRAKVTGRWMQRTAAASSPPPSSARRRPPRRCRPGPARRSPCRAREGAADPEELVLGGIGARHRLAVDGPVGQGARGREAEGPAAMAPSHLFHAADVLRCGRLVAGPRSPSRRSAPPVGDLGADVDRPPPSFEGVEYSGNVSHSHRMPSTGGAGDVLHALHEPDEPLVPSGMAGAKPTPQLPVTTVVTPCSCSGRPRPGGLAVVVGVDVHPTGDQEAVGIHRAAAASPAKDPTPLMRPSSTATSAVRAALRCRRRRPPRITRSCMFCSPLTTVPDGGTDPWRTQRTLSGSVDRRAADECSARRDRVVTWLSPRRPRCRPSTWRPRPRRVACPA